MFYNFNILLRKLPLPAMDILIVKYRQPLVTVPST
jgi:hypothetical protein